MSFYDEDAERNINEETGREILDNTERGCGHLQPNKAYIRSDASKFGALPAFVKFVDPIEVDEFPDSFTYKEGHFRGWSRFAGIQFELSVLDRFDYKLLPQTYNGQGIQNLINSDKTDYEDREDVPDLEIYRHLDRLVDVAEGDHIGQMKTHDSHDLIMTVGSNYYPEPEDFITECVTQGLNKAIPSSKNKEFPTIKEGRTRLFIIHPNAIKVTDEHSGEDWTDNYRPAVIGYVYLTRIVYTADEDGKVPEWAKEKAQNNDYVDIVEMGEEISEEEDRQETGLDNFDSSTKKSEETSDSSSKEEKMEEALDKRSEDEEDLMDPEDIDTDAEDVDVDIDPDEEDDEEEKETIFGDDDDEVIVEEDREDVLFVDCPECEASIQESEEEDTDYECMNEMCGETFTEEDIEEMKDE